MARTIGDGDRTDFDETRRLLYMALLATRTKKYNLAGTLVNALRHHHAVDDLAGGEIIENVLAAIEPGEHAAATGWISEQIGRITAELGD
jgi:hypothetical protein